MVDMIEACVFEFFKHHDIGIQRRDVTEMVNFNFFFFLQKFSKYEKNSLNEAPTPSYSWNEFHELALY